MREYQIENTENKMMLTFNFDKSSTLLSGVFSVIIIFTIFFKIKPNRIFDVWGYILILIIILLYLTFNKYLEWKKHKTQKLEIIDDTLIINDNLYSKLSNIHSVNISYSVNQFESGWTIYLKNFSKEYIIKKRMKENDALEIANKLAAFLNKSVLRDN